MAALLRRECCGGRTFLSLDGGDARLALEQLRVGSRPGATYYGELGDEGGRHAFVLGGAEVDRMTIGVCGRGGFRYLGTG